MRNDTKRLLDRLGQPDFSYREYDDAPATSTDRWPLFEVVARQLRHGVNRPSDEAASPLEAELAQDDVGNDIQSLIARIARGRAS